MTAGDHQQQQLLLFTGRVAVITGAARGLGREYALLLASRGAAVVVNDLGGGRDGSGGGSAAADEVVAEIIRAGGVAVADYHSVEEGHKIVQTAIEKFGRIDILINNAGILRDRSMMKITEEDWDLVHRVHLRGAFLTTRAAWPHFREQSYGRILMTSSPSGLYGNFGQANYSSAKLGLLSLAKTLAVEGAKYDIKANTIIPVAASRLTEDLLPEDLLELFAPRYVAPMVAYLVHEDCPANGEVFEAAGGFYGRYQWRRSAGKVFRGEQLNSSTPGGAAVPTPEEIRDAWTEVVDMKSGGSSPASMQEHTFKLISQLRGEEEEEEEEEEEKIGDIVVEDPRRSSSVVVEDNGSSKTLLTTITPQDVILYALSVGVSTADPAHLQYLYEADEHFTALPTLAASLSLNTVFELNLFQEAITRYGLEDNFIKTLHGEQYLKLLKPIPTSGQLISKPRIVDVLDKGSGALILIEVPTYNTAGELLFLNQLALFMIGSGGFEGGKRTSDHPGLVEAVEVPADRPPDAVVRQVTSVDQAATFRLVGDSNPLHIDPTFSVIGGFERPILHGLCLLGFAVRAALREFAACSSSSGVDAEAAAAAVEAAAFDAAKARFTGAIIPGQTIETRLWRGGSTATTSDGDHLTRIHFECYALETGSRIISSAFVDLKLPPPPPLPSSSSLTTQTAAPLAAASSTLRAPVASSSSSSAVTERFAHQQQDAEHLEEDSKRRASSALTSTATTSITGDIGTDTASSPMAPHAAASDLSQQQQQPCKIDRIFGDGKLREQIRANPSVVASIATIYQFNISLSGQPVSVWTLDLKNAPGDIYRGQPEKGTVPDCTLTVEDEVIADIFTGKEDALKAFMNGHLKVTGNILAASKLQQLFADNLTKGSEEEGGKSSSGTSSSPAEDEAADRALLDSVPISGLKSDIVFTLLRNRMHEEPDFIRRIRASYQFNITLNGKPQATWTAENKTEVNGCCYSGPYRNGKADCIVTVEDEDFIKLMFGKLNPQRAFMLGKLKVKGNIMLLQKLNSLWLELLKSGKAPEFPYIMELMSKTDLIPGLRSEVMIIELVQRLIRLSYLCTEVASLVGFEVLRGDGKVGAQYTLDFTKNKVTGVFERGLPPPTAEPQYCVLTMSDEDFCRLTNHKFTLVAAIEAGRVKVRGDTTVPPKIAIVFSTPTSRVKL